MTLGTFWNALSKQKRQQDDKNLHNKIIKVNNEIEQNCTIKILKYAQRNDEKMHNVIDKNKHLW